MKRCSPDAVCVISTLRDVINKLGEVTIRKADIEDMGATEFAHNAVYMAADLDHGEWRSTFVHELLHLLRGPVPRRLAATEEAAVQHETSVLLFPAGQALAELDREWSDDDIQSLAARYNVDRDVIETAVHGPPTLPFPVIPQIPAQRDDRAARHRRET